MPWSDTTQPRSWKKRWRFRSAARKSCQVRHSQSAAASSRAVHALNASGSSTAMARSGRHVGSMRTPKAVSALTVRCASKSSQGSSVVHTSATWNCFMMPRAVNSGCASFSLHSFQMPGAVSGLNMRSQIPKGFFSSMCAQWCSGLRMRAGTVSAHFMYFS